MNERAWAVWQRIQESFPPVTPPQPVTNCKCEECLDVRAHLGLSSWNCLLPSAVEKHFGSIPLLTDESFQAFPAYLFWSLSDLSESNKVLEFTLYALLGSYQDDDADAERTDARLRARTRVFSPGQKAAVRGFLEVAATVSELKWHYGPIARALEKIWI